MITDAILQLFQSILNFVVNAIPDENPPFMSGILSSMQSNLGGTPIIGNSVINVVVDYTQIAFMTTTAMVVLFALFGANILLFIWHQIKW